MRYTLIILFLSCFNLLFFTSHAQVSGTIKDGHNGEELYGVRVEIQGGQKVLTDVSGKFALYPTTYPVWIKASLMGYMSDSLMISGPQTLNFSLYEQVLEIKTVVVSAGRRNQDIEDISVSMEIWIQIF